MLLKFIIYSILRIPNLLIRMSTPWQNRVPFPEVAQFCPKLRALELNFITIKQEFAQIENKLDRIPAYHDLDRMQQRIYAPSGSSQKWRVLFLEAMGRKSFRNIALCPRTAQLVAEIPNVFQCCFSILEAGKSIPAHHSPYNGYLRYHIGVSIPSVAAPAMRVGNEWVQWAEGVGFVFDDTLEHEIVNKSSSTRAILIVDIERPMGRLGIVAHRLTTLLMRYTYARQIINKGEVLD